MRAVRRLVVTVVVIGGAWWLAARWWRSHDEPSTVPVPATPWPPVPVPPVPTAPLATSEPRATVELTTSSRTVTARAAASWVEPVDGECPDGWPVKVKLRSGLYHLPGMVAYSRTIPDRCYRSAEDAAADGFSRPKR